MIIKLHMPIYKRYIAIAIALLFHISGAVGILFTEYKSWFIQNTPLNLLLMFFLLLYTTENKSKTFYVFVFICFVTGFLAEVIGVNTAWLFGHYAYSPVMGFQVFNVPLLIGVQWFMVILCAIQTMHLLHVNLIDKWGGENVFSVNIKKWSLIIDGALLATFFDYIMEPVAINLNFWQWQPPGQGVPFFNYICWFIISAFLIFIFNKLKLKANNLFATDLLIIQTLFFLSLRM